MGLFGQPPPSRHADQTAQEPQKARPRVGRSRSHRQAPQAPLWSRYGWWSAPPPHHDGQVPSGLLGKVGMRHFHLTKNKYFSPSINLDKLWTLVSKDVQENYAK